MTRQDGSSTASPAQRALFTFLGHTLIGPFLAGLSVLVALVVAQPLKLEGLVPAGLPNPGAAAIATFVWSVIPAALAGIVLATIVWRRGGYPWITAAAAGGIAFMLAAIAMPLPAALALTPLTALAAFVAIGVRMALVSGAILSAE